MKVVSQPLTFAIITREKNHHLKRFYPNLGGGAGGCGEVWMANMAIIIKIAIMVTHNMAQDMDNRYVYFNRFNILEKLVDTEFKKFGI